MGFFLFSSLAIKFNAWDKVLSFETATCLLIIILTLGDTDMHVLTYIWINYELALFFSGFTFKLWDQVTKRKTLELAGYVYLFCSFIADVND